MSFHAGNLCANLWSTFSHNRRGFRACDQFHQIQGTCKGHQSHGILFLSLIFMLEIYVQFCGQRFLEAGEVSGHGTNSIESRGPVRVANQMGFFFYRYFSCWKFMCNSVGNAVPKQAMFQDLDQFHRIQGTCEGGQSHVIFFLWLIFMLEIYVQLCGQRFLETGEVSGPGTNSIESRGPARVANHMGFSFYR